MEFLRDGLRPGNNALYPCAVLLFETVALPLAARISLSRCIFGCQQVAENLRFKFGFFTEKSNLVFVYVRMLHGVIKLFAQVAVCDLFRCPETDRTVVYFVFNGLSVGWCFS